MYSNPTTPPSGNPNPIKKNRIILIALFLLTATNIAFFMMRGNSADIQSKLSEKEQALTELKSEFATVTTQLDSLKSNNPSTSPKIIALQAELESKRLEIEQNINFKGDLKAARREIEGLLNQKDHALAEIAGLKAKVNGLNDQVLALATKNAQYESDKSNYEIGINEIRTQLEEAQTAKAALVAEKTQLEQNNIELNNHVEANKHLSVFNVVAQTVAINKKGKEKTTISRKSVDQIKICFQFNKNDLVPKGQETFHIKVIDPIGSTIFREEQGSGVLTDKDSNTELRFTMALVCEYAQTEGQTCGIWNIGNDTPGKGKYHIEIYNRGKRVGAGAFKIK